MSNITNVKENLQEKWASIIKNNTCIPLPIILEGDDCVTQQVTSFLEPYIDGHSSKYSFLPKGTTFDSQSDSESEDEEEFAEEQGMFQHINKNLEKEDHQMPITCNQPHNIPSINISNDIYCNSD